MKPVRSERRQVYLILVGLSLVSACRTSQVAAPPVKRDLEVSHVRHISVAKFDGEGGPTLTQEMIRALTDNGIGIVDRTHRADAILTGIVAEYKPDQKWMVFLGKVTAPTADGQSMQVSNPVVTPSGKQVWALLSANHAQMIAPGASVNVIVRLLDASNGHLLWADDASFEGLDLTAARQPVVSSLTQSLQRALSPAPTPLPPLKKG